ncbi:hypothetical protein V6N11_001738 [Hibiscus sabdariffa]|uniref:Uncharacterized protein n=1 Tax=Hibiscus sabdariffa TaxID=183260 RepID=A0ABR2NRD1_9ROSI
MREMKRVLKEWNRDSFGNIDAQYQEIVGEIEVLDARLNSDELGSNDLQHKRELYSRLWVPAAGMLEFNVAFSILSKNQCEGLEVELTEAKRNGDDGMLILVHHYGSRWWLLNMVRMFCLGI